METSNTYLDPEILKGDCQGPLDPADIAAPYSEKS
jgi:hypothetical protein